MTVTEIYSGMVASDKKAHHLHLGKLFRLVFERPLEQGEWGFLRRLISMYGSETVFWAMVDSSSITNTTNPLAYVAKVCAGTIREKTAHGKVSDLVLEEKTKLLLDSVRKLGG